jgi:hypothetical protein
MERPEPVRIYCAASSATAPPECRGHVLISGSYGGEYNAWHAARHGVRGVILNDAGVGRDGAGISGLAYLDRIGLAAATADAWSCHIGDGEDMLEHGIVSRVNRSAEALGCRPGETVRACAEWLRAAPLPRRTLPPIAGGKRFVIREVPGEPRVIGLDAAPLLTPADEGAIAVTGSHAALFRGRPDGVIGPRLLAVVFSDGGIGKDRAGISRLPTLDERGIAAGAAAAMSAPIGNARAIYEDGILSHVNATAERCGAAAGLSVEAFVHLMIAAAR